MDMTPRKENVQREIIKQSYEPPTLKEWGTVTDLTESGGESSSGDPLNGSVYCGCSADPDL